jgi:hypothetical protein
VALLCSNLQDSSIVPGVPKKSWVTNPLSFCLGEGRLNAEYGAETKRGVESQAPRSLIPLEYNNDKDLFQKHHFPGLEKIARLQAVEIDSRRQVVGIEQNVVVAGFFLTVYQISNFDSKDVKDC